MTPFSESFQKAHEYGLSEYLDIIRSGASQEETYEVFPIEVLMDGAPVLSQMPVYLFINPLLRLIESHR